MSQKQLPNLQPDSVNNHLDTKKSADLSPEQNTFDRKINCNYALRQEYSSGADLHDDKVMIQRASISKENGADHVTSTPIRNGDNEDTQEA